MAAVGKLNHNPVRFTPTPRGAFVLLDKSKWGSAKYAEVAHSAYMFGTTLHALGLEWIGNSNENFWNYTRRVIVSTSSSRRIV